MNVRDATPDDVEAIRHVHRESILALGPAAYDEEQVAAWASGVDDADYAAVEDDDTVFVVAECDGDVVGFASLRVDPPDGYASSVDAEVTGVYVHPDAAGAGVGTALLSRLESAARARGATSLGLEASRNAVGFYDARGYERVRDRNHEFSAPSGVFGTVVEMKTTLEPESDDSTDG